MNYSIIGYIIGCILDLEALFMLLPCITALIYKETTGFAFVITIAICIAIGIPLTIRKPQKKVFYTREGYITVALSWITLSIFGSIPFVISGQIPSPIDALFETVSGFTTTGASILNSVEDLDHCILLWRSFTHWVGGMGVLVFLLCLLPLAGGYHMSLMRAESPGPTVSKLVPKVQETAKILYGIYFFLTLLEAILLLIAGMPLFDTICTAFGTAGTGGYGILNDSFTSYKPILQWIVTIFMILFGVNFSAYYLLLLRRFKEAFKIEEIRWYFTVILVSVLVITFNIRGYFGSISDCLRHAAFQVGSIVTTTGFATTDFNAWPILSKTILVLLMFMGACAGSTGGGIKVSRFIIMFKAAKVELERYLHPNVVKKVKMDGKTISSDVIRSTNIFLTIYIMIFVVSMMILSLDKFDLVTNFTSVAATLNNIGPGLEVVGPTGNFALFTVRAKMVLIFDMLAGRLEIIPLVLLFLRDTWRNF